MSKVEVDSNVLPRTNGGTLTGNYKISNFDDAVVWDPNGKFVDFKIFYSQYYTKKKEYGVTQSMKARYWIGEDDDINELKKQIKGNANIRIIDSFLSTSYLSKTEMENGKPKRKYFTQLTVYKFETNWRDAKYQIITFNKKENGATSTSQEQQSTSGSGTGTVVDDDDLL